MKLFLIQHGEAFSRETDPDRPLTEKGTSDIRGLAEFLRENETLASNILHSGKTRAQQTAEILATALLHDNKPVSINGIAPNDSIEEFANNISRLETNTMVVGHLPFMANLVSYLVTDEKNRIIVDYQPGSIVCIEQDKNNCWKIQWMIRPDCF